MSGDNRIRVVVVDDDRGMRELLHATLDVLPRVAIVGEAADGVEGVKLVVERQPDVAILDVNMPRLDGFGAAELIASTAPQTRIVIHSAEVTPEKARRAEALGLRLLDKA
jgi:DNA-binding NarL/FixJ family response regulator